MPRSNIEALRTLIGVKGNPNPGIKNAIDELPEATQRPVAEVIERWVRTTRTAISALGRSGDIVAFETAIGSNQGDVIAQISRASSGQAGEVIKAIQEVEAELGRVARGQTEGDATTSLTVEPGDIDNILTGLLQPGMMEDIGAVIEVVKEPLAGAIFTGIDNLQLELIDNGVIGEKEAVNEQDLAILRNFITDLNKIFRETIKLIEERSQSMRIIQKSLLTRISSIRPKQGPKSKYGWTPLAPKKPLLAVLVDQCIDETIEKIQKINTGNDFWNSPGRSADNLTAEALFLPRKAAFLTEQEGNTGLKSAERVEMSSHEREYLLSEWGGRRKDKRDFLNNKTRKQIGKGSNTQFHGGLSIRTASDVNVLIRQIAQEEAKRTAALSAFHDELVSTARAMYLRDLTVKFAGKYRDDLEGIVTTRHFDDLIEAISACEAELGQYFVRRNIDTAELEEMELNFGRDGRNLQRAVAINLRPQVADQGLKTLIGQALFPIEFVHERVGQTKTELPSPEVDLREIALATILGEKYEGWGEAANEDEKDFIEDWCEDDEIEDIDFNEVATALNNEMYCGHPVRSPQWVENTIKEMRNENGENGENGGNGKETEALNERVEKVLEWVDSLPTMKRPQAMIREIQALALGLRRDRERMTPTQIEGFVTELEFWQEHSTITGSSLRIELPKGEGAAEEAVLGMKITLPNARQRSHENQDTVDSVDMRLEELETSIRKLEGQLAGFATIGSDVSEKRSQRDEKQGVLGDLNEEVEGLEQGAQEAAEAIAQYWGELATRTRKRDEQERRKLQEAADDKDRKLEATRQSIEKLNAEITTLTEEIDALQAQLDGQQELQGRLEISRQRKETFIQVVQQALRNS